MDDWNGPDYRKIIHRSPFCKNWDCFSRIDIALTFKKAGQSGYDPCNDFFDLWFAPEECFYQILSISLLDVQRFLIDYKDILVDAGDLVKFEVRIPHEVPASTKTNYYLNFLRFNSNYK